MTSSLPLVAFIILVALAFDYINGFHDAANSIATVVSTQVLTPTQAVVWAAFFNFVAASDSASRWPRPSARGSWRRAWWTSGLFWAGSWAPSPGT